MQMKPRERWKRTCQRLGRGEINEGDRAEVQFCKNGKRIKRGNDVWRAHGAGLKVPRRGYRNDEQRAKISADGERRPTSTSA